MDSKRAWWGYIVVRLLAFVVPFALVMVALPGWEFNWLLAVVVGSIVGLAVSYLFLHRQRAQIAGDLATMRERRDQRTAADREEDEALEAAEHDDSAEDDDDEAAAETAADGDDDAADDSTDADASADTDDDRGADDDQTPAPPSKSTP